MYDHADEWRQAMTAADTRALRALQEAATPGPWVAQGYDHNPGEAGVVILGGADTAMGSHLTAYAITVFNVGQSEADAAYIAALVNAAPALLNELDQLRGQVARVEAAVGNYPKTCESVKMEKVCGWKRAYADVEQALATPAEGGE